MDLSTIKTRFPIFKNYPKLVYLDNASTTQTPQIVLDAMNEYYSTNRANIHRGIYNLSTEATKKYEEARNKIAKFINAEPEEIIFTSGTTHGLNMLATTLGKKLSHTDNIVLTRLEHHANLVPWQQISQTTGAKLKFIELNEDLQLDEISLEKIIDDNTKIVSFTALSNTLGTKVNVETIVQHAKKVNAITIVDAAQLVSHEQIDVKKLDCDFLVFSGHKMYGPTGIGVLYGKKELLEKLDPFFYGGDMVNEVSYETATWADVPQKFEGGTPNIAGAIGLGAAIDFIQEIGWETIQKNEQELVKYLFSKLPKFVNIIASPRLGGVGVGEHHNSIISFTIDGVHPHDIAEILNRHHIAIRAGHHCTMPLMKHLDITGTTRVSLGLYNTKEDIDKLISALEEVKNIFQK